jgi:alpha-glucosidase
MSWWREGVLYQIYPRSFADSDGDGIGDLRGITGRLGHLEWLGIDGIWLNPTMPSPNADWGYDVADYCAVHPELGTLEDLDALIAEASRRRIRVLLDLVPNHTSDRHPWFQDALTARDARYRDFYVWADPRSDGEPPNNWESNFGGSAWTLHEPTGQMYLHNFLREQPDLNWWNEEVREAFDDILRFWFDRGVAGFRIDVAHDFVRDARDVSRREVAHEVFRRWRRIADAYDGDRVLVGEVVFTEQRRVAPYLRPDELHLAFNFSLIFADWDAEQIRASIDESLRELPIVTWVLENHDVTRIATRFGPREARAAALLLLALPGPVFLYQGQELGLPEVDVPDEARQDPVFFQSGGERKGRDGCRVPLPWTRELPERSWLPQPPEWPDLSVEAQRDDAASMLSLYRRALALRPGGGFAWRDAPEGVLAFDRDGVACIVNVSGPEVPAGEVLLASEELHGTVPAGAAAWLRR